jgi:hypothetical protein
MQNNQKMAVTERVSALLISFKLPSFWSPSPPSAIYHNNDPTCELNACFEPTDALSSHLAQHKM